MTSLLDSQMLFDQAAFQNALPIPQTINATKGKHVTLQVRETSQFLGLYDPDGIQLYTTVWGYGTGAGKTSYPGPTIVATEGTPITVNWQNKLPVTGHLLPVDTSLHLADPGDLPQRGLRAYRDPPPWWSQRFHLRWLARPVVHPVARRPWR
jgi:spore coat protein A